MVGVKNLTEFRDLWHRFGRARIAHFEIASDAHFFGFVQDPHDITTTEEVEAIEDIDWKEMKESSPLMEFDSFLDHYVDKVYGIFTDSQLQIFKDR